METVVALLVGFIVGFSVGARLGVEVALRLKPHKTEDGTPHHDPIDIFDEERLDVN